MEYPLSTAITLRSQLLERASRLEDPETFTAICAARHASSTRETYGWHLCPYHRWCDENGRVPVPALPETILDYLVHPPKRAPTRRCKWTRSRSPTSTRTWAIHVQTSPKSASS